MFLEWFFGNNGCLKFFEANFNVVFAWEKSMLSRWMVLVVCSPDEIHYSLVNVDGVKSLD
jgi:hypothetical protein